jgi:hypothetical protein
MNAALATTAPAWTALQALEKFKPTNDPSQFEACCPAHDDRNPSLRIRIADDGRILLTCRGPCDTRAVVAALGCEMADLFPPKGDDPGARPKRRIVATYDYRDETNTLLYQVVRFQPKGFQQRRPGSGGGWIWKLGDVRRVPYRLGPIMADTSGDLWIFEGEKDANRAATLGLNATTTAQGADSFQKTAEAMRDAARGRRVFIVQDEDDAGDGYAATAVVALRPVASSVTILHLPRLTHTPDHGPDFTDWLETQGGSVEELRALADDAGEVGEVGEEDSGAGEGEAGEVGDQEVAAPATPSPQVHPLVQINTVQLRRPVMATLGALREINQNREVPVLFVRGGTLVRVLADEHGEPVIDPLDERAMTWIAAASANYVKVNNDGAVVDAFPPPAVIRTLLGMGWWQGLPALRGTVAVPTLRPDGSILDRPGYDEATHLIYVPAPDFEMPPIPDEPTEMEVAAAVDYINTELLGDFPFVDEASRANAWGLLLTPILRPAIAGGVPLALLDAPSPGSGKSLYCHVVALVATGQTAGILTAPQHDELEWRKRITAALRHGRPVVQIDNLADELKSAQLAAALTTEWWEDRELGYSRLLRLPQRATWMATGNNIKLGGDLPRRCYIVRLNTRLAKPWERKESEFRHPKLLRWVAEHRGELVAALLTIVRGWIRAGRPLPQDPPAMGSFEEWAELCAGVLAFAGVVGLLGNRTELYDRAADEANQWQALLEALRELWPDDRPFTVAMVAQRLGEEQSKPVEEQRLATALPESLAAALASKDAGFALKLGKALSQRMDQRFGPHGIRLEQTGEKAHNKVLWRVVVGD